MHGSEAFTLSAPETNDGKYAIDLNLLKVSVDAIFFWYVLFWYFDSWLTTFESELIKESS